jgi:predicted acetyltransferase
VFTTPRAGRRLLTFLEEFSSIAHDVTFCGGPLHPALYLLAEQRYTISLKHFWMLRVIDIKRCFEARGYPDSCRGQVHIEVRDETIAANSGRWTITVEGGRAAVASGGRGDLQLDARTLAPLFSGYLSTVQLAQLGKIEGDREAVTAAAGVFPTGTPWLSDMY